MRQHSPQLICFLADLLLINLPLTLTAQKADPAAAAAAATAPAAAAATAQPTPWARKLKEQNPVGPL